MAGMMPRRAVSLRPATPGGIDRAPPRRNARAMRTLTLVALVVAALGCRPSPPPRVPTPPDRDVPPGPAMRNEPGREMQGSTPQVPPVVQP
jgi:hypothetical protein